MAKISGSPKLGCVMGKFHPILVSYGTTSDNTGFYLSLCIISTTSKIFKSFLK